MFLHRSAKSRTLFRAPLYLSKGKFKSKKLYLNKRIKNYESREGGETIRKWQTMNKEVPAQ